MTDIPGATASTYTLVSADLGQLITVKVTATNSVGNASAMSLVVGPITAPIVTGYTPTTVTFGTGFAYYNP